jgi:hypothetical protein
MQTELRRVRRLALAGVPLEHIEPTIDGMSKLSREEKALAWIFAWVGADPVEVARLLGCPLDCLSAA